MRQFGNNVATKGLLGAIGRAAHGAALTIVAWPTALNAKCHEGVLQISF
jgi:hypothetical protein